MSLVGEDPFAALMRLQRELAGAGEDPGTTTTGSGAFPPVNVFVKGNGFVVIAEAPGLDRTTLDVEVRRNQLRLAGRRVAPTTTGMSLHRRERAVGDFDRTISLQESVDTEAASASYVNGMFIVNLPHAAEAKPRAIKIN